MKHDFKYPASGMIDIELVGAGGTGSHVFAALCDIAMTLPKVNDFHLNVRVWDGDTVSESNLGRQRFYPCDVGRNKAEVLVHRANAFLGLNFEAAPEPLSVKYGRLGAEYTPRIVIGCVDSAAARRIIADTSIGSNSYWLDCGNQQHTGQVILGQPRSPSWKDAYGRLPTVMELFPALGDEAIEEAGGPSCSVAEAIARQDLFINRSVATAAGELLWALLRHGEINYHGRFLNTRLGTATKLKIDPQEWKRFGFKGPRKPPTRKPKKILVAV